MNKSMLMGIALGAGVATAGGVTAYQFLGSPDAASQGSAVVVEESHAVHGASVAAPSHSMHNAAPAAAPQPAPAQTVARPAPVPAAPQEECYEETVASEPRDKHRIAGTAIGALVGGAVAKDVGDRDLTTAVGAAVGAFAGRKIQGEIQERKATTTAEVRCVPAQ